jgi:hypothetical protein
MAIERHSEVVMATKTVVCPECGSPAGAGRYACAECGALLAAVGPAPRGRRSAKAAAAAAKVTEATELDAPADVADADVDDSVEPELVAASTADPGEPAEPVAAAEPVEIVAEGDQPATPVEPSAAAAAIADDRDDPVDDVATDVPDPMAPFDENAPLAAARRRSTQPDVLHDLPEASTEGSPPLPTAPLWPPLGDLGPLPAPEPRTPAGTYLPPSAVLPPLDGALVGGPSGPIASGIALTTAGGEAVATGSSWADRASSVLANPFRAIRVSVDASRRTVAIGGAVAALGLLLPWMNTLPGASPIANYLERWGLAGPGAWLVLVALVALASIAAGSGRVATWPVGLPAIALAAFVVGLIWPYAVGTVSRPLGIWVVAVGALVLGVGGLLARRARHERGDATV